MKEEYFRWYSPHLGRDTQMLVFGHDGYPVIVFPTSMGNFAQNKDFGLIESARWFVEQGLIKIYCPDGIDNDSWYNKSIDPATRIHNHILYEKMIIDDVIHRAIFETWKTRVALAGCSFGAYHAVNLAFRHPDKVSHIFSMGGAFDIKQQLDGYYSDEVFYNNPPDFIPGLNLDDIKHLQIVLGTSENDMCKGQNYWFSDILNKKGLPHWLDERPFADHDWPIWKEMFPHYLSLIH